MKIYYKEDLTCTFLPYISLTPFVEVKDDFDLKKTIQVVVGKEQKRDKDGNVLYLLEHFETSEVEHIIGYDDTTKKVDSKGNALEPLMIQVQKEDDDCNKLYYKIEIDKDGNGIKTETTEVTEYPIMEETQKLTPSGKPVYKLPIIQIEELTKKIGEEETTEVTDKPVFIDKTEDVEISILEYPEKFLIKEVIEAKINYLKEEKGEDIFYNEFIDTNDLVDFTGNTGLGIVQIPPKTKVKFKPFVLSKPCDTLKLLDFKGSEELKIFAGNNLFSSDTINLSKTVQQVTISIANTTEKYLDIDCLCLEISKSELSEIDQLKSQVEDMQSALNDLILGGMK